MRLPVFLALIFSLTLLAACASTGGSRDLSIPGPPGDQRIVMWRKSGNERIDVVFRRDGKYDPAAFEEIDHLFRDSHSGETYAIDPQLIELIAGLRDRMVMAIDTPIELLSGYRSPETNEALSHTNKYVAKQSYHMKGMAADIRIPDMNSRVLELVAKTIQKGGVALYPDSQHVHVDTGPVRGWEVIKGFEAGLERREDKAREAAHQEKAALIPMADRLPPVTIAKLPAPKAIAGKTPSVAARPVSKPVISTPPKAGAKPVLQSRKHAKAKAKKTPAKKAAKKTPPAQD